MSNIKNTTDHYLRKIKAESISGQGITGLASGAEELDKITHSFFQECDVISIAGRPAIGKSSLALSMVKSIALDRRKPVIYVSPSMTGEKIAKRLLSIGRCSPKDIPSVPKRQSWYYTPARYLLLSAPIPFQLD